MAMLLTLFLSACGDGGGNGGGTGPVVETVASVTLSGAPTTMVLAGTTVQLTATPVSASGAALANRTVTWLSSDTTIATVSGAGAVSVAGVGSVTITARCEGKEASATLDARTGGSVGPAGGALDLLGGRIRLVVPPGSLNAQTEMLFRPAPSAPAEARIVPGTVYELATQSTGFYPYATLTLAYDPARLPAGVAESSLQLYQVAQTPGIGTYWMLLQGSAVNPATRTVTGAIGSGGVYAVIGTAAKAVTMSGDLMGAALYAGQARQLAAAAVDVNDDTLAAAAIAWSSSDPARATVDATGRVTGVSAGAVTITASLDGKSASTSVTVLARPVASWSHAADWSSVQGNARHDGYVAATLDPAAFQVRWQKQFAPNLLLERPVATGAGRVFVDAAAFNSPNHRLVALDEADGSERWSRTFLVSSMSAPAFGNGRVWLTTGQFNDGSRLFSLDAGDGSIRSTATYHISLGHPMVDGGSVYVNSGGAGDYGNLHRADAASGEWSWESFLQGSVSIPAVAGPRAVMFAGPTYNTSSRTVVFNTADGSVAATVTSPVGGSTPVLGGAGSVLATTGSALVSLPLQPGTPAWSQPGFFSGLPVVGGGRVLAMRGFDVVAFRETDGTQLWTWRPPVTSSVHSLLVTDNLLFVSSLGLSTTGTHALDMATGKQVWSHPLNGHLALSAGGTLYIASHNGKLTAVSVK